MLGLTVNRIKKKNNLRAYNVTAACVQSSEQLVCISGKIEIDINISFQINNICIKIQNLSFSAGNFYVNKHDCTSLIQLHIIHLLETIISIPIQ